MPLHVRGQATAAGEPCVGLRVDVLLIQRQRPDALLLGSLATGPQGLFDGAVFVPRDAELGDHELLVSTPGHLSCPPGRSR